MLALSAMIAATGPLARSADEFPNWAYPACVAKTEATGADGDRPLAVPGSTMHFTAAQIKSWSKASDWFPHEHEPMPAILASAKTPAGIACAYCHLPDGSGRPENSKLAGLPAAYILDQVSALKARERRAAQSDWAPTGFMVQAVENLSAEDLRAAAEYFSRQKAVSWVKVIETDEVPHHQLGCFIHVPSEGPAEPLGLRIVELPSNVELFEHRDPHTEYFAYVPKGSIERGRLLAQRGGGRTQACQTCHGEGLRGAVNLPGPPLAGRFPGYLFRQLYGFQTAARKGGASAAMAVVVAHLSQADMIDLAAFAAVLSP